MPHGSSAVRGLFGTAEWAIISSFSVLGLVGLSYVKLFSSCGAVSLGESFGCTSSPAALLVLPILDSVLQCCLLCMPSLQDLLPWEGLLGEEG